MQSNTQLLDDKITEILLKDRTTGKNIMWATDNYKKYGEYYNPENEITLDLLTHNGENIIRPRVENSKQEQEIRIKQKAEVFTPTWFCNAQNNLIDNKCFEKAGTFNLQDDINHTWETTEEKIIFPATKGKTWKDFVKRTMLELTCGEAPYITSRYDTVSGSFIGVPNRIGFLDRKLRVVGENTSAKEEWLEWAENALKSTYAFEWQGDNLLIARENLLLTVIEHYEQKFVISKAVIEPVEITLSILQKFAEIISWNLWQMDGLKFVIPNSCKTKDIVEQDLFETRIISKACEGCKTKNPKKHNGIYCKIKDWKKEKTVRFVDCLNESEEE